MNNVIVVGGGITGVSAAWRLAQEGAHVTLLEGNSALGEGATRASFAWINANNKSPFPYFQLNQDGLNHYHTLQNELGNPRWLHFDGNVEWADSAERQSALKKKTERLRSWGYTIETLPVAELRNIAPMVRAPKSVEELAYFPQEGYANPIDLLGHLASICRRLGVDFRTGTRVAGLLEQSGRITGVRTDSGEQIAADMVVIATGAQAPDLLQPLGFDVPMASNTGVTAVTEPLALGLQSLVHASGRVHFRPEGAGRIMFANGLADSLVPRDAAELPAPPAIHDALDEMLRVLPKTRRPRIDSVFITTRPVPADGLPFVGHIPGLENVYLLSTHSGITMGPLLGKIAAREITSAYRDPRLSSFRPGRELVLDRDRRHQN